MGRSKNVDSWMAELDPSVRRIAQAIRDLILDRAPHLNETIKWSQPVYQGRSDLFYISATERYATLGFFHGADLDDPHGRITGTGKRMRHVKVRAPEDLDPDQLAAWVLESVAIDRC